MCGVSVPCKSLLVNLIRILLTRLRVKSDIIVQCGLDLSVLKFSWSGTAMPGLKAVHETISCAYNLTEAFATSEQWGGKCHSERRRVHHKGLIIGLAILLLIPIKVRIYNRFCSPKKSLLVNHPRGPFSMSIG